MEAKYVHKAMAWSMAVGMVLAMSTPVLADPIQTFDNPITTGPTQAAGTWYTDRYAPNNFQSVVSFDGDNRLLQTISSADGLNNRVSPYNSAFYNTQGRKYDVNTTYMSIDLWIPDAAYLAANVGSRYAGFWGTAIDGSAAVSGYPIVEYRQDTNGFFGFSVWNGGGWDDLGTPTNFVEAAWYTLEMNMVGDDVTFSVGDITHTVEYTGSVSFTNAILQGYNTTAGVSYDIYWDNFTTEAPVVPVPGAAGLGMLGMGLVGYLRRRKAA